MTVKEMKKFLGLTFITGITKKAKFKICWTDDCLFSTPVFFSKTVPRNQLEAILAFLHFSDVSSQQADFCEICKIKPICEMLSGKCF
jgi:hypothetical protein